MNARARLKSCRISEMAAIVGFSCTTLCTNNSVMNEITEHSVSGSPGGENVFVQTKRPTTSLQITARRQSDVQKVVSQHTTLKQLDHNSRGPRWLPLLSAKNKKMSLQGTV